MKLKKKPKKTPFFKGIKLKTKNSKKDLDFNLMYLIPLGNHFISKRNS